MRIRRFKSRALIGVEAGILGLISTLGYVLTESYNSGTGCIGCPPLQDSDSPTYLKYQIQPIGHFSITNWWLLLGINWWLLQTEIGGSCRQLKAISLGDRHEEVIVTFILGDKGLRK